MTLLWAVPVVAAAVATAVVAAAARPLTDEAARLAGAVGRLGELRAALGAVRAETAESAARAAAWQRHHPGGDGAVPDPAGDGTDGRRPPPPA